MVLFFDNETKNDFCKRIEKYVEEWNVPYLDAVVNICEETKIPIESVAKILSKPIVEKLQQEGQELNFLPKSSKLPI